MHTHRVTILHTQIAISYMHAHTQRDIIHTCTHKPSHTRMHIIYIIIHSYISHTHAHAHTVTSHIRTHTCTHNISDTHINACECMCTHCCRYLTITCVLQAVWIEYKLASNEADIKVAHQFAPHITVMKPMSDLCWVCQQNSVGIMRAANTSE